MATQVLRYHNSTSPCVSIICCYVMKDATFFLTAFTVTHFLLSFPLCLCVLFMALQRWWRQGSSCTTAVTSPADVFAYHVAAITLTGIFGCLLVCGGQHVNNFFVVHSGLIFWLFSWYGETFFHTLTCLERYLAVAHPIMYRKLKSERGIFLRNCSFVCVWLLSLAKTFMFKSEIVRAVFDMIGQVVCLIIALFCNFIVFCILIRPSPGKQGRDGADRAKQKAFIITSAFLWTLFLRFLSNLVLYSYVYFAEYYNCVSVFVGIWFNIPSSLVAPILFLYRTWK